MNANSPMVINASDLQENSDAVSDDSRPTGSFENTLAGAWDSYVEGGGSRPANRSRQDVAHKAAWLEVRRKFLSKDGHLARRSSGQQSALT